MKVPVAFSADGITTDEILALTLQQKLDEISDLIQLAQSRGIVVDMKSDTFVLDAGGPSIKLRINLSRPIRSPQ